MIFSTNLKYFLPKFTKILSECDSLPQPEVVWSTSYIRGGSPAPEYRIEGIFTAGGNYWLANKQYTGHGFTIKLSDCKMSIVGVHVKNIKHRTSPSDLPSRATRSFIISGVLRESDPREPLLEEEFENPFLEGAPAPTLQTLYFKEVVEVYVVCFLLI